MSRKIGLVVVAIFSAASLLCLPRLAQAECKPETPLAQCSTDDRAQRLELGLQDEARKARTWRYAWTGINGALAAGSFGLLLFVDEEQYPDYIISGIGSTFTSALTFFTPLDVESNAEEAVTLRSLPADQRLRRLETLTLKSHADAKLRASWPFHALNFAGCVLVGSIIAFGYDHYVNGVVTGVSGFAIGEVQLFTQPTGPKDANVLRQQTLHLRPFVQSAGSTHMIGVAGSFF
jgi:hypothetical protein